MQNATVYRNGIIAGYLTKENENSYLFKYDDIYLSNTAHPSISLTLPRSKKEYRSKTLFPFFYNMLSEGINKQLQCRQLQIDETDYFGLLVATAQKDTIGAITVIPNSEENR